MRRLLLITGLSSIVLFTSFVIGKYLPQTAENAEEKEGREIAGAIQWWNSVRSNEQTGIFDPADVRKAWEQANAQSSPRTIGISWEEMGPDNIGGRTRAILFDKDNPGVMFAGGVSGGLWKSPNGGESFVKVSDATDGRIVVSITQAANGDIYFGTGEGFFGFGLNTPTGFSGFGFPGDGIWKSTDHGATFTQLPSATPVNGNSTSEAWAYITKLAASPTDPNRIYAATNTGLKITTDGGTTWVAASGTPSVNSWDVKTGTDGYVYAIINNKYYRSTAPDGDSFELRSGLGGFTNASLGRIELAVSSTNAAYVYAACINGGTEDLAGIYKSTDGGLNWTLIGPGNSQVFNPPGFQGTYDICLGVLPSDPDVLFCGGQLNLWRYSPSQSWYTASGFASNSQYIHPDMHVIVFNPFDQNQLTLGCDGGLFRTDDASQDYPVFYDINRNYNVTQFYSVSAEATGEVIGGAQDNGTLYIDFLGNTTKAAHDIQGGDGMNTEISKTNSSAFFSELYSGQITRSANKGFNGSFSSFLDNHIDNDGDGFPDEGADWVAPFNLWEATDSSRAFYALGAGVSAGHVWFTTGALNFSIDPEWFQFPSTTGWVTCVAFSKDGNYLFAGTSSGVVYRYGNLIAVDTLGKFHYASVTSTASSWHAIDSGVTVSSVTVASGRYLRSIAVDPTNTNNIIVTAARFGSTSYVWRSTNALDSLMTFGDITDNLPAMPVWSSVVDADNPNIIVIATELGVWSRDLSTSDGWIEQNTGMSRVPTITVKQVPYYGANYLYIGTYGRGIFRSGSLSVGINPTPSVLNNVMLFPNPVYDQATLRINLAKSNDLDIDIFDLSGTLVHHETRYKASSGENVISIDTRNFHSGTYLVKVKAGSSAMNQKMVVIK